MHRHILAVVIHATYLDHNFIGRFGRRLLIREFFNELCHGGTLRRGRARHLHIFRKHRWRWPQLRLQLMSIRTVLNNGTANFVATLQIDGTWWWTITCCAAATSTFCHCGGQRFCSCKANYCVIESKECAILLENQLCSPLLSLAVILAIVC